MNLNAAQHIVHLTDRSRRVFEQFAWPGVDSGKRALSPPAHQGATRRVTRPAGGSLQTGNFFWHHIILENFKEVNQDE